MPLEDCVHSEIFKMIVQIFFGPVGISHLTNKCWLTLKIEKLTLVGLAILS